jgi:MFS family permease
VLLIVDDIRVVFWVAVVPAFAAVVILVFGVSEPPRGAEPTSSPPEFAWRDLRDLGPATWWAVGIGGLVTLARLVEAFYVLRAAELGLSVAFVPAVMMTMSAAYALSSFPAGRWSDRGDRRRPLMVGTILLATSNAVFAGAASPAFVFVAAALAGLHLGLTQAVLAALVADSAPVDRRGTAFGAMHLTAGVALVIGGGAGGLIWERFGASVMFGLGAALALLAFVPIWRHTSRHR